MTIGLFGGTFNPPHLGHLRLLRAFAQQFVFDRVLIVPTFVPPHKAAPDLADAAMRLEMCRMLFADARFEVSDIEIRRAGKSYTVETLEALHAQYPDAQILLLMGTDMFTTFDSWYRSADIRRLCTLCAAIRRPGETLPASDAVTLEHFDPVDISSTEVRRRVRDGEDVTDAVGSEVAAYIVRHELYIDAYTAYRRLLRQKLGEYRLRHSFAVADSAAALAKRYGGDCNKAYLAGLLHDIMKDAPQSEQLRVLGEAGVQLTEAEACNPKLWHAMAGEAYLRTALHFTDSDLLHAVRYHTTGRAEMSLLEKIIYIADYISADRHYNGVQEMRRFADESLERAMEFGQSFTIADLASKGQVIHPDSLGCYNALCIEKKKRERAKT